MEHDPRHDRRADLALGAGSRVPHFEVATLDGSRVRYADAIWQLRNLLLVLLPETASPGAQRYLDGLRAASGELAALRTTLVLAAEAVGRLRPPAVIVADEWGEIAHVEAPAEGGVASLSPPEELLSWVRYLSTRCPECEGEVH
jgi:hypothetical protein